MRPPQFTSFIFLLLLAFAPSAGLATDLTRLVKDTQRIVSGGSDVVVVWWIPTQFWEQTLKADARITPEQTAAFIRVIEPYTVFCVIAADAGVMGGLTPRKREVVLENTTLRIGQRVVRPLTDEELSPDAKNFFRMMKPLMSGMLGPMGEGMEFIAYKNSGKSSLDPLKEGAFSYDAFGNHFKWRLPLGSLLPSKVDAATGEEFPGDFKFNPYTGAKLEAQPEPKPKA